MTVLEAQQRVTAAAERLFDTDATDFEWQTDPSLIQAVWDLRWARVEEAKEKAAWGQSGRNRNLHPDERIENEPLSAREKKWQDMVAELDDSMIEEWHEPGVFSPRRTYTCTCEVVSVTKGTPVELDDSMIEVIPDAYLPPPRRTYTATFEVVSVTKGTPSEL